MTRMFSVGYLFFPAVLSLLIFTEENEWKLFLYSPCMSSERERGKLLVLEFPVILECRAASMV
jgi:hypothetical protein